MNINGLLLLLIIEVPYKKQIAEIANALRKIDKVLVITGAGVSAESGIPTFRGKDGWWRNYDPMELASPEGFARDAKTVWEWYNYRRQLVKQASPNPAHKTLAQLEPHFPYFLIATQNVDRLHQRAGAKNVIEVHGTIMDARCCQDGRIYSDKALEQIKELPPHCSCGALLRPNVVWFGEMLPEEPLSRIQQFVNSEPPVGVAFIIGTSALFAYIQNWAYQAKLAGARLVEINLDPTPLTQMVDFSFQEKAGEILPEIYKEFCLKEQR